MPPAAGLLALLLLAGAASAMPPQSRYPASLLPTTATSTAHSGHRRHDETAAPSATIIVRSIEPEPRKNHLRRRPVPHHHQQQLLQQQQRSNATQIVRTEDGKLKILTGGGAGWRRESDIIFPGPTSYPKPTTEKLQLENGSLVFPNGEPCDNAYNFCENVEGYDQLLENVLKNNVLKITKYSSVDETDPVIEISQRHDFSHTYSFCESTEKVIFPQVAKNKENNWLLILNNEQYKQGVRVETCGKQGAPCLFADRLPNGYEATCKQKFVYRTLLTVDAYGEREEKFSMPSCCQCSIKVPGDIGSRIGIFEPLSKSVKSGR